MRHELKTWPIFYNAILDGTKTFECRKNDRDFKVGDTLVLKEFIPAVPSYPVSCCGGRCKPRMTMAKPEKYTGRQIMKYVSYVLKGEEFGIKDGFAVMGLSNIPEPVVPCLHDGGTEQGWNAHQPSRCIKCGEEV